MADDYTDDMDSRTAEVVEHDFAQLEHVNQVIYDNLKYDAWECFDTAELLKACPEYGSYNSNNPCQSKVSHNVVDVRYNSIIVNIDVTNEGYYVYEFEVRNALWNGAYKITHSKNSPDDEDVLFPDNTVDITSPDKTNILRVVVNGDDDDIKDIRVCFHLQMDGSGREINETSLRIESEDRVQHQFDTSNNFTGYVYDELDKPATSTTVKIVPCDEHGFELEEGIQPASTSTNDNGNFILPISAVEVPGIYYVLVTATRNTITASKVVTVDKIQGNSISMIWGDDADYNVYKGSIKTYELQFRVLDKDSKDVTASTSSLEGTPVNVTSRRKDDGKDIETVTCQIDSTGLIHPQLSYRGLYDDSTTLLVTVPATSIYESYSAQRAVLHDWYIADTYKSYSSSENGVVNAVTDEYGPDFIMVEAKQYDVKETLQINRDLTLCGVTGDDRVLFNGGFNIGKSDEERYTICRITDEEASSEHTITVNFYGLAFTNANCAILIRDGSNVTVDNCYFHNNDYNDTHNGVSIHQVTTDETHKNSSIYNLLVQNSTFYNNVGTEIMSIGTTSILNNLFRTGNRKFDDSVNDGYIYLAQPSAKVVAVHAGEVTYKYNKSFINTGNHVFATNNTVSKALCRVWSGARFNGKAPNVLHENDTLSVFGDPWYNEAFTYAIYYYPNDSYKSELVCSPATGNERRATGHRAEGVSWTFWDGYYFVRWNNGQNYGNTSAVEKWSDSELEPPGNQGVYNVADKHFIDNSYDPRVVKVIH